MSNKHTPGPWKVAETYAGRDGRSVNVYPISSGEFGNTEGKHAPIAEVRLCNGSEFSEANARLIAAAPEMFEALKEAKKVYEEKQQGGESYDRLCRAVAKAEGK